VLHFVITLSAFSAAMGILLFDVLMHLANPDNFRYMGDVAALLLVFVLLNFPICMAARNYGVANLRFLSHESYLVSRDDSIEQAFLSPAAHQLMRLLDQLENASVMDRQPARRQLRDWLEQHHQALTLSELEYVQEQFGYLFDPVWKERGTPVA
jgi:hypothetical protein